MTREQKHSPSRRRVLGAAACGAVAIAAGALAPRRQAAAEDKLPHVSLDDPTAKQLNYRHNAAKVQSGERQGHEYCHNCRYFKAGEGAEWGPCDIFPGKSVNADGWCNVWSAAGS